MSRHNCNTCFVNIERVVSEEGTTHVIKRVFSIIHKIHNTCIHETDDGLSEMVTADRPRYHSKLKSSSLPSTLPVGWVTDSSVVACMNCDKPFGYLRPRRHHCRMCGNIICRVLPIVIMSYMFYVIYEWILIM